MKSAKIYFALLLSLVLAVSIAMPALAQQDTKTISAKALTSHGCNSSEWHFVITQIESENLAPASIHVVWANGQSADIQIANFTGGVAHYSTSSNLGSVVTSASAQIYQSWSGEFNLSHGPCGTPTEETPTKVTPTTVTPTTPVPTTETPTQVTPTTPVPTTETPVPTTETPTQVTPTTVTPTTETPSPTTPVPTTPVPTTETPTQVTPTTVTPTTKTPTVTSTVTPTPSTTPQPTITPVPTEQPRPGGTSGGGGESGLLFFVIPMVLICIGVISFTAVRYRTHRRPHK